MGNPGHWDEQRRRLRHRVQPLVGFVGVGGKLKVIEDERELTVQPATGTVIWLMLASIGLVPYAMWAFFQTVESPVGLIGVVGIGAMLEFLLLRFLMGMQRLRIIGNELVVQAFFGGKVTRRFRADDFASIYVGDTWYRSDGIETRNNVIWLRSVGGDDIPLVASDKDVDEVAVEISGRLGLPTM